MILRDRLIQRLRQICQVEIRLLLVQQSRRTLYTAPNGGIRTEGISLCDGCGVNSAGFGSDVNFC
ncbi:hypothetical protein [Nostoc sp.]|uniref:hypothetical protein n=1 Tax=Nostoc sp. TaxID=1180 RepID=UPI002FF7FA91